MDKTNLHSPQPLPDSENINRFKNPLFKTVKTRRISSFLDYNNLQNDFSQSIFSQKNQSIMIGARQNNIMNKTLQNDNKTTISREKQRQEKSFIKLFQKKKPQTGHIRNRKLRSQYPTLKSKSTIKKHLIKSIDFKEIQNKLYKRREWMTRYEYFYDKLQHKKQTSKQKTINLQINGKSKKNNRELTSNVIKKYSTICVRSTPKKKFWIRQKIHRNNPQNYHCIHGTSFKSTPNKQI